jgi:hypothetical protein
MSSAGAKGWTARGEEVRDRAVVRRPFRVVGAAMFIMIPSLLIFG